MGYMYCARAGDYVKIGFSNDPDSRLRNLRCSVGGTQHPTNVCLADIELEGRIAGTQAQEIAFHKQFRQERISGTREWYLCGSEAHEAFRNFPDYTPEPEKHIAVVAIGSMDHPLEDAIWMLELRRIEIKIQNRGGSLSSGAMAGMYILDRASEYLCKQL